jgi:hypothetical protein
LQSQAADLRAHLDLLLSEQVMIVAKESAAAVNHSDEYAAYTTLLATNSSALSALIASAFGNTSAAQFAQLWDSQNSYLVDYAIGVVTHNDLKSVSAISALTDSFAPAFAQVVNAMSRLPLDQVAVLMRQQIQDDKAFIDDVFAGSYSDYYAHLDSAYMQTTHFGDALAAQIAVRFADKFPGDAFTNSVSVRVSLNNLLQEHSYLVTMATDATIAGRTTEASSASPALHLNADRLASIFAQVMGGATSAPFRNLWTARTTALLGYANGDVAAGSALTDTFSSKFASFAHVEQTLITMQIGAELKVIDDQRSKSSKSVADDDRAAATAMQPIADSIQS